MLAADAFIKERVKIIFQYLLRLMWLMIVAWWNHEVNVIMTITIIKAFFHKNVVRY